MVSEWKETTLGEVVNFRRGHDLPRSKMVEGDVPVIGSNGAIGSHNESTTSAPCITIGRSGNVGKPHLSNVDSWAHNTTLYIDDYKGNDSFFVYHFLKTLELENFRGGSAVPTLNRNHIHPIEVTLPPLPEQKAIAHILGTLDDKIELNRRMNATLEGMAQALFKSWFVDFDPVIDNALAAGNPIPDELAPRAEVRRQALANGTANREAAKPFPAAFQETEELGLIPEGWDVEPLGEHLNVLETGRRPKGGVSKYKSGVPSVGAESIFGIGQFNFGKLKFVPEEFFEKMNSGKVESYDVLLYKDGGKPGEFKPRSGMYGEGFPFESFGINEHVFRMRSSSLGQAFLYYQVSSERVFHHFAVRGGKAAIPGINQKEVNSVDFLIPGEEVRELFNDFSQPIFEKILKAANHSRMLTKLRDTLLPKLISGELRISETEPLTKKALNV